MPEQKITVYTRENCTKSERLRKMLNRWGVDFEEKNVTENRTYLKELQNHNIFAAPVTFIGDQCIQGVQHDRLKSELDL
ncbi:glutaredoxin family protein [Tenuibacillus multivorans]|uniref:Glutaredoxin n=1 Tax=Tenuibacillus multivorans TaxID=237069 RepID=A0A1H0B9K1_9BACI|nr:glutaredoxin family protein [Tenuibacillus multivorans]GEL78592.1 hypothetical protein TMU01_28270 [Tenuibacillus multivorans]SDN42315.1 Glutaredoxin [Tenuibacillus multivorans]